MKILVTPTSLQPGKNEEALETLREFSAELVFNPFGRPLDENEVISLLNDCDGYVAGLDQITRNVFAACPNLKAVSRYGAGYDRIDTAAAKQYGVTLTNTPGVNSQAVGELAFSLILSVSRNIPYLNEQTRAGEWVRTTGMELKGKTLGIIGLGAIGKVVARCGQGFGMNVIAYDSYIDRSFCADHRIRNCSFAEVIALSDVISLHLPLNSETHHLIDADCFDKMKDKSILVNTSRGGIIDENAAYQALKSKKIRGLGLDAFEVEPPKDSKLFEFTNVIATPHAGAHTEEATYNMAAAAVKNLIDVLSGNSCPYIINQ